MRTALIVVGLIGVTLFSRHAYRTVYIDDHSEDVLQIKKLGGLVSAKDGEIMKLKEELVWFKNHVAEIRTLADPRKMIQWEIGKFQQKVTAAKESKDEQLIEHLESILSSVYSIKVDLPNGPVAVVQGTLHDVLDLDILNVGDKELTKALDEMRELMSKKQEAKTS